MRNGGVREESGVEVGRGDRVGAWVRGGWSRGGRGGGVGRLALLCHHLGSKVGPKEKDGASGRSRSGGGEGKWREGWRWRCGRRRRRNASSIKRFTAPGDRQGGRACLTPPPFLLLVIMHLSCPGLLVPGYERRVGKVVEDGDPVRRQTGSQRR